MQSILKNKAQIRPIPCLLLSMLKTVVQSDSMITHCLIHSAAKFTLFFHKHIGELRIIILRRNKKGEDPIQRFLDYISACVT